MSGKGENSGFVDFSDLRWDVCQEFESCPTIQAERIFKTIDAAAGEKTKDARQLPFDKTTEDFVLKVKTLADNGACPRSQPIFRLR